MKLHLAINPPRATQSTTQRILKSKKTGKMFIGRMSAGAGAKAKRELLAALAPFRPAKPLTGPLEVTVFWVWPHPQSVRKSERGLLLRHDRRPDSDNLQKLFLDAMTEMGFWKDDGQISDLIFRKRTAPAEKMGVYVALRAKRPVSGNPDPVAGELGMAVAS